MKIEHQTAVDEVGIQTLGRRETLVSRVQRALGLSCELRPHGAILRGAGSRRSEPWRVDVRERWARMGVSLAGKTALVTGSTDGLGKEVAHQLGALGAVVIVHGRNEQRGAYSADVGQAEPERVRGIVQRTTARRVPQRTLVHESRARTRRDRSLAKRVQLLTYRLLPLLEASAPAPSSTSRRWVSLELARLGGRS
jgi:hypothetical protein